MSLLVKLQTAHPSSYSQWVTAFRTSKENNQKWSLELAGLRIFQLKRHFSMEVALRAALVHMADVRWSECEESGCTIQHEMGPLFSCDSHWFYSFPTTHFVFNHQVRMKNTEVPWHGKRQRDLSESDWAQASVDCMIPSDPRSGSSCAVLVELVRGLVMLWLMSVFSQRQCQSCLQCCLFVNTVVLTKTQKKTTVFVNAIQSLNPNTWWKHNNMWPSIVNESQYLHSCGNILTSGHLLPYYGNFTCTLMQSCVRMCWHIYQNTCYKCYTHKA